MMISVAHSLMAVDLLYGIATAESNTDRKSCGDAVYLPSEVYANLSTDRSKKSTCPFVESVPIPRIEEDNN